MLGGFEKALLAVLLLVLMTGMGATLTPAAFGELRRAPRGVLIGLASQFGFMPLLAFTLARGLSLPPEMAIGLILVGCTPGGTTSNLFTYYARADLALSISMTVCSTVVAVVAMPLLLMLYASPFTDAELGVPYGSIASTLALVLVPVMLGMWIRGRNPALAARVEQVGSVSGVLVLVLLVGSSLLRNADVLSQVPADGYLAAIAVGLCGMGLGYGFAGALRLPEASRRAVALETGIQNSPLALGIIVASFPAAAQDRMLWLPLAYALFVLISASMATLIFRARPTPALA
ncbi:MAG: bile acid:sodium symporter [Myxococcales bacterium]|jgi:BASS family bile acid:Na+ symporter